MWESLRGRTLIAPCCPIPARGAVSAQNFLHLLALSGETVPYIALSPIRTISGSPISFAGRSMRCKRSMAGRPRFTLLARQFVIEPSASPGCRRCFPAPPSFRNALVQSIGGGQHDGSEPGGFGPCPAGGASLRAISFRMIGGSTRSSPELAVTSSTTRSRVSFTVSTVGMLSAKTALSQRKSRVFGC